MPFGPAFYKRWTTPGMNSSWYSKDRLLEGFKYLQYTPQMFNWMLAGPFIGGYRTFLTSKFGYPSKYDRQYLTAENKQASAQYDAAYGRYGQQVDSAASTILANKITSDHAEARKLAAQELSSRGISAPEAPPVVL
jgi:hypothetical protein